jgi:hypothetical protein
MKNDGMRKLPKSRSVMDQYIQLSTYHNGSANIPLHKQTKTGEERTRTDMGVKICNKCKIAWEGPNSGVHGTTDYYNDYPSIGKKREDCPKCTKKK